MEIKTDNDSNQKYETNDFFRKIINFFLIPVLNVLPSCFRKLIQKSHKSADHVIRNVTNHSAIETLYNHGDPEKSRHFLHKIFHKIWFNLNNSKAVRNRLKLVKKELKKIVWELLNENKKINLLSIASGSARAIVDTVACFETEKDKFFVSFLDKDEQAIEYSKKLANQYIIGWKTRWINDTANNFPQHYADIEKPNIIEMVGLLDYFDDEKVKKILSTIYNNLQNGGFLITANIDNNKERKFITNVIGWKMIYRNGERLAQLAIDSGFDSDKIRVIYESLKIHAIVVVQK